MADKHPDDSGSTSNTESSESTMDIRIKTLDSQSYQFHVDRNMLVSAFKEKIASDVGLPVAQQRLIFRGKVLKDELPLSEYHVGSGDTLHLVARQQPSESQPSSGTASSGTTAAHGSNTGPNANAGGNGSRPRVSHISHSVVLGTFGDRNEDGNPDISRVIGAVLNSIGIGGPGQGQGQVPMGGPLPNMQFNVPVQVSQGNETGVNGNNQGQQGNPGQRTPQGFAIPLGPGMALPTLVSPIPDSLHTLSEFMNRMEQALSHNGYQLNQPPNGGEAPPPPPPPVVLPSGPRGVPTPAALAVVMRHAQQLLNGPVTDSLSHTARRLEEEESCTDVAVRAQIQSEAMQSGLAMQHLGALLLELGRTMLTLRVGQSHAESSVYAGPAVYISPSGPNPIMVQPFPLQTHSVFGGGMNATPFGPVGVPRHINVHIHAGMGPRGSNGEPNQEQPATNETPNAPAAGANGVNVETRGVDVSINTVSEAQPDGQVSHSEARTVDTENTTIPSSSSSSSTTKPATDASSSSSSSTATPSNDNSTSAPSVPLGLGLGGLQPKKRSKQTKAEVTTSSSNVSVPAVSAATTTPAGSGGGGGGQLDPGAMMRQMVSSPALDGLLSGVSSQTGMGGSPDVLRNMLGQLTQNPAMMNTVNQMAQQLDENQDLGSLFSGGGGGGGGGFDLSGMIQQMMPIVAQALGGGGSGGLGLNMLQQQQPTPPSSRNINDTSSGGALQVNVGDVVERIEQQESPEVVFSSVVEAAAARSINSNNGDGLSDLLIQEGLVDEFMEMMKTDISQLLEEEGGGEGM